MRITVLGCSGSVCGPDSAASGYLLTAPGTDPVVLDFGPGVLGALQRHEDPSKVAVMLTHLHADHCLDLPGLLVWRRYHPSPPEGRVLVYGPTGTSHRIGCASAEVAGDVDDVSDTMRVEAWHEAEPVEFGELTVTPMRMFHPPEAYGLRITDRSGATLVYTGDTGMCDEVVALAEGADVLLCEASWTHTAERPEGVHLSGTEAGRIATRAGVGTLLLTHIPPWTPREEIIAEAKAEFAGPVEAVVAGGVYDIPGLAVGGGR
ncbi:MBL fold metallo-hydrolase [Rhodococcus rhodnii]|nr:cyclic nucleotide-degrading phosphodiesterase [Rhodococcus rhodnii]TXG92809.1 MBL fold metallo-hydrolase [Rhodococcus rhodnii]